jgi:hypothetical protein
LIKGSAVKSEASIKPAFASFPILAGHNWLAVTVTFVTLIIGLSAPSAESNLDRRLNINMPSGRCSLNVFVDGSASLSFGAMPRWAQIAKGTFDFEQLVAALSTRSFPTSDSKPSGVPQGTTSLPGKNDLMYFYDLAFARSLFDQAWQARIAPNDPGEVEDHAWVAKSCLLKT